MFIFFRFSNGEVYKVHSEVIVRHRLYSNNVLLENINNKDVNKMLNNTLENAKWLYNNMKWSDLKDHAILVRTDKYDYDLNFTNIDIL